MNFAYMMFNTLAQRGGDGGDAAAAAGFLAVFGAIFCGALVISLAIMAVVCWFLSGCLQKIPTQFRKQEPGMVWLLMIPVFSVVWSFFVFPKIADSFKAYFDSIGRTDVGDCGRGLAMALCIVWCVCLIPYVNACAGIAALVLLILVLVKFNQLKGQIQSGDATNTPPAPTA